VNQQARSVSGRGRSTRASPPPVPAARSSDWTKPRGLPHTSTALPRPQMNWSGTGDGTSSPGPTNGRSCCARPAPQPPASSRHRPPASPATAKNRTRRHGGKITVRPHVRACPRATSAFPRAACALGRRLIPVSKLMALTEAQVRDRARAVTRRTGWRMLRPEDQFTLCRKVLSPPSRRAPMTTKITRPSGA
jgi:hypothetical protein